MEGKLPPQNTEAEKAVLGALMLEREAIDLTVGVLNPNDFYMEAHETIYSAIIDLHEKSNPVDIITITQKLHKNGKLKLVGGPSYISELTSGVNSAGHIGSHIEIIKDTSTKRKIIQYASGLLKNSYEDITGSDELLEQANLGLNVLSNSAISGDVVPIKGILTEVMDGIEKAMELPDGITGIPTGFKDIDRTTGGWQRGDLIIIAGRPSMGKTAFAVNNMRNTAVQFGIPVAFFSCEMSPQQLVTRMVASEVDGLNLTTNRLTRGRISENDLKEIHKKIGPLAGSKVFIDNSAGLTLSSLRVKATKLKRKHDIQLIMIDYLQLMHGSKGKGNREQEIAEISRGLKELAKTLNVPVIALSQLSRAVETRGGEKKPQLSDLRESGAIEQDADVVAFLYRPEYYKIMEDESGRSLKGVGQFLIAKHRSGALDEIYLKFVSGQTKFTDINAGEVSSIHSMPYMDLAE